MKTITAIFCLLAFSTTASAQSADPSNWMGRNLADSGGFTYQGETIFGTQACRPIPQAALTAPPAGQDVASTHQFRDKRRLRMQRPLPRT